MEELLLRFPHIGEQTFKQLSNRNLTKCKTVTRTWYNFIKNDRFCKQRAHYEKIQKDQDTDGRTQLHKTARDGQLLECKLIIEHVENKNPADDCGLTQRRLDPGKETLEEFFQVENQKEYQNVVIISFVHLEKIFFFCFMHKGMVQKLSLPCPLEN